MIKGDIEKRIMKVFNIAEGTRTHEGYLQILDHHEKREEYINEIKTALLKDLVDISISAQKVIQSGSYQIKDLNEVIMLRTMTEHILNTYTKVKSDE